MGKIRSMWYDLMYCMMYEAMGLARSNLHVLYFYVWAKPRWISVVGGLA